MALTSAQRDNWRQLWAEEADLLAARRAQLLVVAQEVAQALHRLWPGLVVRVFGSVDGPGFHAGSDLDLAVEGLPPADLAEAQALAERQADATLARLGGQPVALDLIRLEALPEPWRERILGGGRVLA
jgi:predicted nucleotidyltransferase